MIKHAFYTFDNFNFHTLKIGYNASHLISIDISNNIDHKDEKSPFSDKVFSQLNEYFEGKRKYFDIPLQLHGSEFQLKVWHALSQIPYGQTRSYKQIAEYIGHPKAYRAVGLANNKNPIMIIVPCHRVIGSNGSLTGYAGGLDIKQTLLNIEKNT